jgi:AcrR family transcriptional regulator
MTKERARPTRTKKAQPRARAVEASETQGESKTERTRRRILTTALDLFRREGFDRATMRRIAEEAGVSLGLAYHYFPSKEAIALAFYRDHVERHVATARRAIEGVTDLRERIEIALATGLDVRGPDRPLLNVMARTVVDPENPISLFAKDTTALREASIGLFREVVAVPEIPDDLRETAALALWALHLGLLLRYVHDDSPTQRQTRKLLEGAAELAAQVAPMLGWPITEPFRGRLIEVLEDGGVLPRATR